MAEPRSPLQTSKARRSYLPSPGVLLVLTLLTIGGVVSVLLGFRYNRHQQIIAHVEAHGGTATTSLEPEWLYEFIANSIGEERARGFGEIVAVDFNSFQVSSYGWGSTVSSLPALGGSTWTMPTGGALPPGATVATGEFSDDTLRELGRITSLKSLNLYYLTLGNNGLRHVSRFTNLESIFLCVARRWETTACATCGRSPTSNLSISVPHR